MSKRLFLLLVLIILTVSGIVVLLAHVNSDPLPGGDSLPNGDDIPDGAGESHGVEITDFKWTSDWMYLGGVSMDRRYNVTIHNWDETDIEGLTMQVKLFAGDKELIINNAYFDGLPSAGEVRQVRGAVITTWDELPSSVPTETVVKVMLGDVVLDELTVP
jgi:hypothetical protein